MDANEQNELCKVDELILEELLPSNSNSVSAVRRCEILLDIKSSQACVEQFVWIEL